MQIGLWSLKWKGLIFLFSFFLLFYGGRCLYQLATQPTPQEAVQQGLRNILQAENYCFQVQAIRQLKGEESVLSDLQGQKSPEGIYLCGVLPLLNANIEIYYLGETLYRRDPFTQGWVVVPTGGRVGIETLIQELNPLSAFNFPEGNFSVKYTGKERVNRKKCRVFEVMTRGENKYLELFWQDFNYILWIEEKGKFIRQAQITAEHRDDAAHYLKIVCTFDRVNVPLKIQPPVKQGEAVE